MNVIPIILALGLSFLVSQLARADEDSPDELIRRIAELSQQGKYKEAIPPAEHLGALMKEARGDERAGDSRGSGSGRRLWGWVNCSLA